VVIVFISPSAAENNSETDWATIRAESIPRKCPECSSDSVIGHGRRRKQAHDEDHDWIGIRRGLCTQCWKTITFLPLFSLPYTHYSLIARSSPLGFGRFNFCAKGSQDWPVNLKDLYPPSLVLSPLHPVQLAGSRSGAATTLSGALFVGRGDTYAEGSRSGARSLHRPSMVAWHGPLPTGGFLSAPNVRPPGPLVGARRSARSPS
jgi:hypothetical protein